jgi:hypothetical protein
MKNFLKNLAFQILLYKGSQTDPKIYNPLIQKINQLTKKNVTISDYKFFKRNSFDNDTLLIGHSFGGYFSLLDYFHNKDKIKGIVLLNSHFNSRQKAIYPAIRQKDIDIPVLTMLGMKDERLPIKIGIDDYFEKIEKHLTDKYYIINENQTHFTGLNEFETSDTIILANQITDFINDISNNNFSNTLQNIKSTDDIFKYDFNNIIKNTLDFNWSLNLYDGLLKIAISEFLWNYIHYLWFLYSKPTEDFNIQFFDGKSIFLKTKNITIDHLIQQYENNFNIKLNLKSKVLTLPTLGISIPIWLSMIPFVNNKEYQIIQIIINNNTVYYKLPNPNRILLQNIKN